MISPLKTDVDESEVNYADEYETDDDDDDWVTVGITWLVLSAPALAGVCVETVVSASVSVSALILSHSVSSSVI
ncbi:unnamed protein product [Rhizophagus irregularis]|nr:unnamed protein product [Rhizophagus irregularis]